MRKTLAIIFALIAWFAVIEQLVLMLHNSALPASEILIRFFSYFTILTNSLVALYFTMQALNISWTYKPGILTGLTVYIFIVGIVYQLLLRHLWQPAGMQLIVDELLHTLNPLIVLLFWYLYEKKREVKYSLIKFLLIYPLCYLVYILLRGSFSGFYPYPFVNVTELGWMKTLLNSFLLTIFFIFVSWLFIAIGRKMSNKKLLSV